MSAPAINEQLIRNLVEDVIARLKQQAPAPTSHGPSARKASAPNRFGIFADANDACEAAAHAQKQLTTAGVEGRRKVEEIVKTLCEKNAEAWGRIELEETKIGRLDHKIEKLKVLKKVPGVDFLRRVAITGDNGATIDECAPFGVIGAITPSTH